MISFRSNRTVGRALFATMLGVVLVVGCAGTATVRAEDDGEEEALDTKMVRGFLKALGLKRDGEDGGITYRERSPLVLPPSKDLPPPEATDPAKVAGWPDDPDVKERKRRKTAEKNRKAYVEGVDDRPLLPSQYEGKGTPRRTASSGDQTPSRPIEETRNPLSQVELGTKSIFSKIFNNSSEEYATFTSEPARTSLTDPPAGYRTPSPNQPFGVGQEKWKAPKIDRQEPVR